MYIAGATDPSIPLNVKCQHGNVPPVHNVHTHNHPNPPTTHNSYESYLGGLHSPHRMITCDVHTRTWDSQVGQSALPNV